MAITLAEPVESRCFELPKPMDKTAQVNTVNSPRAISPLLYVAITYTDPTPRFDEIKRCKVDRTRTIQVARGFSNAKQPVLPRIFRFAGWRH